MFIGTTWIGHSNTRYFFDLFPIDQRFNPVAGVFVVCKRAKPSGWQILYVSDADNFREALNTQRNVFDRFPTAATHIATMAVPDPADRQSIVADLRSTIAVLE